MDQNSSIDTNPYINTNNNVNLVNQNPYINNATTTSNLLGSFDTQKFLLGAAVGALGAYLLTNENAQKAIFKTVAKGGALFSAGVEEMKERFEDAKAEMEAEAVN